MVLLELHLSHSEREDEGKEGRRLWAYTKALAIFTKPDFFQVNAFEKVISDTSDIKSDIHSGTWGRVKEGKAFSVPMSPATVNLCFQSDFRMESGMCLLVAAIYGEFNVYLSLQGQY